MNNSVLLYNVTLLHVFIDVFLMFYIFIFKSAFDIYYCTFVLLQTLHWGLLKNECIITYTEKKLIDSDYQLGDNIKWHPHEQQYHFNQYIVLLKSILIIGTLLFIIFRNNNDKIRLIAGSSICLWIYYTYFY